MAVHTKRGRWSTGATLWLVGMVGLWIAFGVVALMSGDTLQTIWDWVVGLALAFEVLVWIVALPFMLALAVWQSSWPEWLQVVLIGCFAIGWTLVSIPHGEWAKPHDVVATRSGLRHLH